MVRYDAEVRKEAVDFIEEIMDDFLNAMRDDEDYLFNDSDIDDRFFECVTDRSYSLTDAAFVIENSNNVETDSGLWEGQEPAEALESQAAFTFSNDVRSKVEEIYEDVKSKYDDTHDEVYSDLEFKHEDEDDYDPDDDAIESAMISAKEYFYDEYDPKVEVVTLKEDKIRMIERYLHMKEDADMWSGYPCGDSYIDSRCGVGFGMPGVYDYVEFDHMIARAIPDISGLNDRDIKEYLNGLKSQ